MEKDVHDKDGCTYGACFIGGCQKETVQLLRVISGTALREIMYMHSLCVKKRLQTLYTVKVQACRLIIAWVKKCDYCFQ